MHVPNEIGKIGGLEGDDDLPVAVQDLQERSIMDRSLNANSDSEDRADGEDARPREFSGDDDP